MGREEFKLRAKWLSSFTGMVTCIEPAIGSTFGAPDTYLVNDSVDGFLEFKMIEVGGTFLMRQNQRIWHLKYQKYRANSGFCILSHQGFWIVPSKMACLDQHIKGEPLDWPSIKPGILTFALKQVFSGVLFNRDSVEHLIEPLAMKDNNNGEKAKTCRASC